MDWRQTRERVMALPILRERAEYLRGEIERAEAAVARLLREYEKGRRGVEKLQNETLSAFLFLLVGKHEQRLDERMEAELAAKLRYDNEAAHLARLRDELAEMDGRIAALAAEERQYQAELAARREQQMAGLSRQACDIFAKLWEEYEALSAQMARLQETKATLKAAMDAAWAALDSLDSAKSWSTVDLFTRSSFLVHIAKYSHIDEAEENFNALSHYLGKLYDELGDRYGLCGGVLEGIEGISSTQRAVDLWFDNIFTTMSVKNKLANNADEISDVVAMLNRVEIQLDEKRKMLAAEIAKNRQAEEELLISK